MTATLLFALASLGCSDTGLTEIDNGQGGLEETGTPDIEVNPLVVDFGEVQVTENTETVYSTVTISNVGDLDLHLADFELLEEIDSVFGVGVVTSVLIKAGGSVELELEFLPNTAGDFEEVLFINSDDPDEPTVEVTLMGTGIAPVITLNPTDFDFGSLYIGCEAEQDVVITNVGNDDLVVDGFDFNTGSADLAFDPWMSDADEAAYPLPWTLAPGETTSVYVTYFPLDEYNDTSYLFVNSNDPKTPAALATQAGLGELYGLNLDVFEQPINGATDILFALDWSCSMWGDIANVSANFDTFVTTLSGMDADYHVAAIVGDDGCVLGSDTYIDNSLSVSDQLTIFDTMTCMDYGGSSCPHQGYNTERAFSLLEASLSSTNIGSGGCNEGFYREDGTLSLVGVSDEPEQSVNPYTYYVSLFQSMKSDTDDVVMHAIGGDYPTGCSSASAYTGFYEATVATGGLFLSICATDFGTYLEKLAEGSAADLTSFELTDFPVPETIVVTVNGFAVNTGWEYDSVTNTIDFEVDTTPEGGSTIEVEYALYGDCEG